MLSEKNWKLESVLRLLLGVFLCLCFGQLAMLLVPGATDPKSPPTVGRVFVSAICFQGAALALIWRFLHEHKVGWRQGFGLRHAAWKALGWGVLLVCLFLPVCWMLQILCVKSMQMLGIEPAVQPAIEALQNAGQAKEIAAMAIATILLAPIAEEILFRGVLYPAIKQYGYPRAALWGSSALFAAIHLNLTNFFPLLLLALMLVWVYEKTDNLIAPVAAHALFNAVNFVGIFMLNDFARKLPGQS